MAGPRVTLYGKPGCCLCDEMRAQVLLAREAQAFALEEVDITLDPVLERRYREAIPVLCVDGEEAFRHRLEAPELARRLATVAR